MILWIAAWALMAQEVTPTPAAEFEQERLRQLVNVKRVFVEKLAGENAEQVRDMILASLREAQLFIVTENEEKADAVLKGSAKETVYTDTFQYSEHVNTRASTAEGRNNQRNSRYNGVSVGEGDSARISERRQEAAASLRLVNKDGDLIWSTTQESRGAKFRGAASDVADKVARKMVNDFIRARKTVAGKP